MNYKVGDVISYRTFADKIRICRVIEKCSDVKNHKPGFSGTLVESEEINMPIGMFVWGYDSQVETVAIDLIKAKFAKERKGINESDSL